jgi:hypothetical protein
LCRIGVASLQSQPERIEDLRIPAVKGLPDDIYHMLHHSFVEIANMRRSREAGDEAAAAGRREATASI